MRRFSRLDKLEPALTPEQRHLLVWDDQTPGCVERKTTQLIANGSATSQDRITSVGWQ